MFTMSDLKNTRCYQEIRHEVLLNLVMRLLEHRIGGINQDLQVKINKLSVEDVENLGLALLDFTSVNDLVIWLNNQNIADG
jgi:predicted transposase YdaD